MYVLITQQQAKRKAVEEEKRDVREKEKRKELYRQLGKREKAKEIASKGKYGQPKRRKTTDD